MESKQFIKIEAINPIIAYLMIKSFNAISTNNAGETLLDKTLSFEDIKSCTLAKYKLLIFCIFFSFNM